MTKGVSVAKQPAKPRASSKPKAAEKAAQPVKADEAKAVKDAPAAKTPTKPVVKKPTAKPAVETAGVKTADKKTEASVEDAPAPLAKEPAKDAPVSPAPTVTQQERPSVFFPMLVGGVIAGAIGYGAAYYQFGMDPVTAEDLAAVRAEIPEMPAATDLSGIDAQLTTMSDEIAQMDRKINSIATRMDGLETRPNADGTLPQAMIDAFEGDMQALRDRVAAQQDELQAMAEQTAAQLETTRSEALRIEENAVEAARAATAKASLARVQGALETGAPFGGALGELESALGEPVPQALEEVSDGAATLGSLQSEFPVAARSALASARADGTDGEETGGFSAFLRSQLDVRSVAPKEGTSVDAILSRAEAALRDGRLNDALAELGALPEATRSVMSEWLAQAEARASAIDAAETLSNTLSAN